MSVSIQKQLEFLIDTEDSKDSPQDSLTVLADMTQDDDGCFEIVVKQVVSGCASDGNNGWQEATAEQIEYLVGIVKRWISEGDFYLNEDLDAIFFGNVLECDRPKNVTVLIGF